MLNIVNGQVMLEHFKQNKLQSNELIVPFNEAMCFKDTVLDIMNLEFIELRSQIHGIDVETYKTISVKPLMPLFLRRKFDITLWFDEDMFCQINLITVLAFLEQINRTNDVTVNLVNENFEIVKTYTISPICFTKIYEDVLIQRIPTHVSDAIMQRGIDLYLEYKKEINELTVFIQNNLSTDTSELVLKMINQFPNYGLGDTQYLDLIQNVRANNK